MDIPIVNIVFLVIIHYFSEFYVEPILAADRINGAHDDLIDVHVHYQVCCLADYVLHEVVYCLEHLLLEFQALSDLVDLEGGLVQEAFEASLEKIGPGWVGDGLAVCEIVDCFDKIKALP